jgi:hypothetical protein
MKFPFIKKIPLGVCFAGMLTFGMTNPVRAQEEGIEEMLQEFFISETVYAQEKNEVQFTSKPAYWKKEGFGITSIPLQLEYGFTDRFQVELNLPYYFLHPKTVQNVRGTGNMEVGLLYNILKGNKPFALSLALDVGLPTANKEKEIDEAEAEWEPSLIIAKQVGRGQVHVSLGAEITKTESEMNYKLGTVFPFGAWRATLELNGTINNSKTIYLTPGFIWKGLDDFEFGLGFSKSITGTMERGTILMATYEFSLTRKNKRHI